MVANNKKRLVSGQKRKAPSEQSKPQRRPREEDLSSPEPAWSEYFAKRRLQQAEREQEQRRRASASTEEPPRRSAIISSDNEEVEVVTERDPRTVELEEEIRQLRAMLQDSATGSGNVRTAANSKRDWDGKDDDEEIKGPKRRRSGERVEELEAKFGKSTVEKFKELSRNYSYTTNAFARFHDDRARADLVQKLWMTALGIPVEMAQVPVPVLGLFYDQVADGRRHLLNDIKKFLDTGKCPLSIPNISDPEGRQEKLEWLIEDEENRFVYGDMDTYGRPYQNPIIAKAIQYCLFGDGKGGRLKKDPSFQSKQVTFPMVALVTVMIRHAIEALLATMTKKALGDFDRTSSWADNYHSLIDRTPANRKEKVIKTVSDGVFKKEVESGRSGNKMTDKLLERLGEMSD